MTFASTDDSLEVEVGEQEPPPRLPCMSCTAIASVGPPDKAAAGATQAAGGAQPLRCDAQEKRDLVLEGLLRWAVDVHFRRCSLLLQDSLLRAVCGGARQALDAAAAAEPSSGRAVAAVAAPGRRFPLGCRLLLSFVGGLAADGGARVASFLQERCGAELRLFLARARGRARVGPPARGRGCSGARAAGGAPPARQRRRRWPELPVLEAYVDHLCLSRHVSDTLAATHLGWLAQQALAVVLRLQDGPEDASGAGAAGLEGPQHGEVAAAAAATAVLVSLSHAVALLLTRPSRGGGSGGLAAALTEAAGRALEIVFDSDARPLSGVPVPLAEAAIDALKEAGQLQLARPEELLRPPRTHAPPPSSGAGGGGGGASFISGGGTELRRRASVAFSSSWSLAAAGLDTRAPSLGARKRCLSSAINSGGDDDEDDDDDDDDDSGSGEDFDAEPNIGSGWGRVPDEVTLRIFSFMTPKRVCRLACVDRAWRELLMVPRVWRPLFEARWPVAVIDSEEELAGLSRKLLLEGSAGPNRDARRRKRRERNGVVRWRLPEVG